MDYRRLDSVTVQEIHPTSRLDEHIALLVKAEMCFTLVANLEYLQIENDYQDVDKNVFVTHHGLLNYCWMLFWLKHFHATLKRALNDILTSGN